MAGWGSMAVFGAIVYFAWTQAAPLIAQYQHLLSLLK